MLRPILASVIGAAVACLIYPNLVERARDEFLPYPELTALGVVVLLVALGASLLLTCREPDRIVFLERTPPQRERNGRFKAASPTR